MALMADFTVNLLVDQTLRTCIIRHDKLDSVPNGETLINRTHILCRMPNLIRFYELQVLVSACVYWARF